MTPIHSSALRFWLVCVFSLAAASMMAAEVYVSPRGNDAGNGTAGQPFATIKRAVEALRKEPASALRRVIIKGGKYYNVRVELTPADSGLEIEAAPGEKPVLYGGQHVVGWHKLEGELYAASLPPFPHASDPQGWQIRALEVDGKFAARARFPAEGTLIHVSVFDVPWMSTIGGGWKRPPTSEELTTLKYRPGDLPAGLEITNAEITVFHMWDESCVGLAAHDPAKQVLKFSSPLGHPPGAFGVKKYVLWNIREGVTRPGQWYHDRVRNQLVYRPLPGQNMDKVEVIAPTTMTILNLAGQPEAKITNVVIRGLTLAVTTVPLRAAGFAAANYDGAISLNNAENCTFADLLVARVGGHGINAKRSIHGVRVLNSEIADCGAGGIYVGGNGSIISNNHVHAIGRAYPSAVGIFRGGENCRVSHNEVHDCTYSAINYGGRRNIIENNLLYDCMKVLHDGAAIYVFGGVECILRGNFTRDITDFGGYGASAYYLDETSRGCLVESNLSVRVQWPAHNHLATNNTIRQNVFIVNGDAKITFPRSANYTCERNVLSATGKIRVENPAGVTNWHNNLFFSGAGRLERVPLDRYAARPVELGPPDGVVMADPMFENVEQGDYRFKPGSPAHALGILPIDVSRAGRIQSPTTPRLSTNAGVEQVIVVFKTHFDIGYTEMASNVVQRYRTAMIDAALQVVDQNRNLPPAQQFAWTIPGWPMHKITEDWPGQTAERKTRIFDAFKQGRFVVHALPFTTHTELLELEDITRGLDYAAQLTRAAGLPLPRDAKMTDVPCHSWVMPTLLRHAGVDFLHLGCNAASRSPEIPVLFWWEGPDRSRLLTMYTAESYGTGLVPPKGWPHKTWLALIHTGDNHGPPTPAEVSALLAEAKQKLPGVNVRIGRLSDFADAILAENAELPVVRGDMPDTWIHGPLCDPAGARLARNTRPAILSTELLHGHLAAWGVAQNDPAPALAAAWEQSLLYGEHTWGGALYWVSQYTGAKSMEYGDAWKALRAKGHFNRLEASWAEHTVYIENADRLLQPALAREMQNLALAAGPAGKRIVVYNPLPWKRDGLVEIKVPGLKTTAVRSADDGHVVPTTSVGASLRFVARDIPPMGYRTFVPTDTAAPQANQLNIDPPTHTIENEFLKATFDPRLGVVRSLIEKSTGRELVDAGVSPGFGAYLYERFDDSQVQAFVKDYVKISAAWATNELGKPNLPPAREVPYRAVAPQNGPLEFTATPVAATAVFKAEPSADVPHAVTTRFILPAGQRYLEIETTLHNKPADPWPEAGWICLPLKVEAPQFRVGRLGSVIDPVRDIVPGANRHLLGLNTGLAVLDGVGQGTGICPIDHPLISLDQPGCWKYSKDFVPRRPRVYVNIFNNQWTTNFRLWNQGTWTSRVRVWPIQRYAAATDLVEPALAARYPLMAEYADSTVGKLPSSQAGIEFSRPGMLVTAWAPGKEGWLLRAWEHAGVSGNCEVRLPAGVPARSAQPVDLRGEPIGSAIPVREGRFSFALTAFAPASFLLTNQ